MDINVEFKQLDLSGILKGLSRMSEKVTEAAKIAQDEAAEYGAAKMRNYISTRPTPWMAEHRHKDGRIRTGKMLHSVGVTKSDGKKASFGWVGTYEEYFGVQEGGGTNTYTGNYIPPMHAMFDSFLDAQTLYHTRLKAELKKAISWRS